MGLWIRKDARKQSASGAVLTEAVLLPGATLAEPEDGSPYARLRGSP